MQGGLPMKKIRSALLAALLLLTLSSCGEERENDETTGYDDSLIKELYSEEGEYTDGEGNTMAYRYHVPQLVSETAVAAALNAEIADRFGALAQEQKNMMASHASLVCPSIGWQSYWNGSLLCLTVRAEMDGDVSTSLSRRHGVPRRTILTKPTATRSAAARAARILSRPTPSGAHGRFRTRTSTRRCGSI